MCPALLYIIFNYCLYNYYLIMSVFEKSPVVSTISALLSTFMELSIASTRIVYTVFGESELMEPITVLPLNCANTGCSFGFFGVAVSL